MHIFIRPNVLDTITWKRQWSNLFVLIAIYKFLTLTLSITLNLPPYFEQLSKKIVKDIFIKLYLLIKLKKKVFPIASQSIHSSIHLSVFCPFEITFLGAYFFSACFARFTNLAHNPPTECLWVKVVQ